MAKNLRIVSLIASATEIVHALGLGDSLVGRSHECDFPPSVKSLPQCTSPKFQPDGSSYEIDQRVKAILQESLSVYRVDASLLDELAPTHIITQSQCEVCAVSLKDVEEAACQMIKSQPLIVSLEPNSLHDVWNDIQSVGSALGHEPAADRLIGELVERLEHIREIASLAQTKPTVAFIEWIDPLMSGGNWMPTLIGAAGGVNLFGAAGSHSPPMSWDDLREADPDIVIVAPCGFDVPKTLEEMPALTSKPGWRDMKAVKSDAVYVADGNQYFNRPGPRLLESLEILAELIQPDRFHFEHQGAGWTRFNASTSPTRA